MENRSVEVPGFVCSSSEVREREHGICFRISDKNGSMEAFVVRFRGTVHGYVNRCPHVPADNINLDAPKGKFFDRLGRFLVCRRHSAWFDAASGECVRGPCKGAALFRLDVVENDDGVFWLGADEAGRAHGE